ncbi:MAG TPA: hypothetical protein VFR74_04685 [Jiangellales bacterium]|nr:hypothetical protein [Jiangellales bacterium]
MGTAVQKRPGVPAALWHVTLSVAGVRLPCAEVRAALERLAHERPFLHAGRYATDRAEVRYWEEAPTLLDAATLALRLWPEHRGSALLPDWQVVGLEVLDRDTYHHLNDESGRWPMLAGASQIRPF